VKRLLRIVMIGAIASLLFVVPALAQGAPDFTQFGFPTVVVTQHIEPPTGGTITGGQFTVTIVPNSFVNHVNFSILTGPASNFQANAPQGQTVIDPFAFKVMDATTGQLVDTFLNPVTVVVSDPNIHADSLFFNVDSTGAVSAHPGVQTSEGQMTISLGGAGVGWFITSPATAQPTATPGQAAATATPPATSGPVAQATATPTGGGAVPTTGGSPEGPMSVFGLGVGAVLVLAGGLLLVRRTRTS
jgi:hypothetical protein